jgi:hypothetical protein
LTCIGFTRGWTLQELLAPAIVEFFSQEGERLGDKKSLVHQLEQVTQIAHGALAGDPLSSFSVDERMSWTTKRRTKRDEDAAYCLFGLFDLHMPLLYGEGRKRAFIRLLREIQHEQEADMPPGLEQALSGSLYPRVDAGRASKPSAVAADTGVQATSATRAVSIQPPAGFDQQRTTEMQEWWDNSVAKNLRPDGYVNVAVLLINWAEEIDELRTFPEASLSISKSEFTNSVPWLQARSFCANNKKVKELESVFRERYNFHTEIVQLNLATKPQLQLTRHLSTFIETYDKPDSLLIVYYSGHGVFHEDQGYLELTPELRRDVARVNWTKAEETLHSDDIESDILVMLDTTYASNTMKSGQTASHWELKRFELLSACTIDQTTAAPGPNSFTRALIDALIELVNEFGDRSFSTFYLNQRINLDKRRYDSPSQLWSFSKNSERQIHLARLKRNKKDAEPSGSGFGQQPQGYLTLRLALRDGWLRREQIEHMARSLTRSFGSQPSLGVRRIEWVAFKTAGTSVQ